ncbi:unnamed protein product [Nippostrongylus brasiliensis]|uniref:Uncharacterized protein n=1 Tax=Nippostrongylus brasiliensis TaxID=27835 RepID=A0A0N4XHW4_NIPBR|nr:unnamed protein product [Nippostrongylus brasiliensis]
MSRVVDYSNPPAPEKKTKINSCREAMFGERARKWAFIFIVAFLACLTIKDVVDLECAFFLMELHKNDWEVVGGGRVKVDR